MKTHLKSWQEKGGTKKSSGAIAPLLLLLNYVRIKIFKCFKAVLDHISSLISPHANYFGSEIIQYLKNIEVLFHSLLRSGQLYGLKVVVCILGGCLHVPYPAPLDKNVGKEGVWRCGVLKALLPIWMTSPAGRVDVLRHCLPSEMIVLCGVKSWWGLIKGCSCCDGEWLLRRVEGAEKTCSSPYPFGVWL